MWKAARRDCGSGILDVEKNVGDPGRFPQLKKTDLSPQPALRFSTESCCQLELMFEEIARIVAAMCASVRISSSILRMDESTVA